MSKYTRYNCVSVESTSVPVQLPIMFNDGVVTLVQCVPYDVSTVRVTECSACCTVSMSSSAAAISVLAAALVLAVPSVTRVSTSFTMAAVRQAARKIPTGLVCLCGINNNNNRQFV